MKNKFKVGDKVQRTHSSDWCFEKGKVYTVRKLNGCNIFVNGVGASGFSGYFKPYEWTPQNGEMINVNNGRAQRVFIGMDGDLAICKHKNIYTDYDNISEIKPTHTITIDGKTAEISSESMIALKELLLK